MGEHIQHIALGDIDTELTDRRLRFVGMIFFLSWLASAAFMMLTIKMFS